MWNPQFCFLETFGMTLACGASLDPWFGTDIVSPVKSQSLD